MCIYEIRASQTLSGSIPSPSYFRTGRETMAKVNVGELICQRAAQVEDVVEEERSKKQKESGGKEDVERQLNMLIPASGSHAESWQLKRLRETIGFNQKAAVPSSSSSGSTSKGQGMHTTFKAKGIDSHVRECELYWEEDRLIWAKSGIAVRTFTFAENVRWACWAWFDAQDQWEEEEDILGKGADQDPSRVKTGTIQRGLCIFLQSSMIIQFPHTGQEYLKRLDFDVLQVFPLDVGLLIQRRLEREDRKRMERRTEFDSPCIRPQDQNLFSSDDDLLPNLFYLRRPLDEVKPVYMVDDINFQEAKVGEIHRSNVECWVKGQPKLFNLVEERLIHVSRSHPNADYRPYLMVTYNGKGNKIRIYSVVSNNKPLLIQKSSMQAIKNTPAPFRHSRGLSIQPRTSQTEKRPRLSSALRSRTPSHRMSARFDSGPQSNGGRLSLRMSMGSGIKGNKADEIVEGGSMMDRNRNSSNGSNARRISMGLAPMHTDTLQEEADIQMEDAKGMHHAMQLLDELDAVGEREEDFPPTAAPQSVARKSSSYTRRRSSRLPANNTTQVGPGQSQALSMMGNTISHIMRTPFSKGNIQMSEEVHASRPRTSSSGVKTSTGNSYMNAPGINADPFLISDPLGQSAPAMAASLSQKDENSKFAQNIDQMNRSTILRGEGLPYSSQFGVEGFTTMNAEQHHELPLDLFHQQIQAHAAVCLIDEVDISSGNEDDDDSDWDFNVGKTISVDVTAVDNNSSIISITIPPENFSAKRILRSRPQSNGNDHLESSIFSEDFGQRSVSQEITHAISRDALVKDVLEFCCKHLQPKQASNLTKQWADSPRTVSLKDQTEWSLLESLFLHEKESDVIARSTSSSPWEFMLQCASTNQEKELREICWLPAFEQKEIYTPEKQHRSRQPELKIDLDVRTTAILLNFIAQDFRLDTRRLNADFERVGCLILKLAIKLNWHKWIEYWARVTATKISLSDLSDSPEKSGAAIEEPDLFDIYAHLQKLLRGPSDDHLTSTVGERSAKVSAVYKSMQAPLKSYRLMSGSCSRPAHSKSRHMVEAMLQNEIDEKFLQSLPLPIALPMLEARHTCRSNPPIRWSRNAYQFVGRFDLAMQLSRTTITLNKPKKEDDMIHAKGSKGSLRPDAPKIPSICFQLFNKDHRLIDVSNMLQTSRAVATRGPAETNSAGQQIDEDILTEQQKQTYVSISDRLKATSLGRAMFLLSSEPFQMASHIKIAPICLRIRMLSHSMVQHREPDAESAEMEWPEFHNGVSAALQLSTEDIQVESSWIYSQTSGGFSPRNAGFIFGLGLQGQLRNLGKIHAHHYLSNRHLSTTIGLLLGISISFIGSCDVMAKALMSIHLIHTLPTHSKPLKTTMIEQSAALVGLGFIFLGSNDRWASRMALRALGTNFVMTDDSQIARRECFSLSAGFSLGLICLGKGADNADIERDIVPHLESVIIRSSEDSTNEADRSSKDQSTKSSRNPKNFSAFEWRPDISITTTPASIALALIFLRSNRADILAKLPLPDHLAQLDDLRPDILQIRVLCRSMIMWDSIEPSEDWLQSVLPQFMQSFDPKKNGIVGGESLHLAFWNMRVGAIFAIGLKFAGSNDKVAKHCLLEQLSLFQNKLGLRPVSYFEKVLHHLLRSAVDTVLTSLAIVAAGSGDAEILKLIRKTLFKIDQMHYGNYMASTMAMGMLFLGGGRFTLGSSNLSIAALLISFFPLYPLNAQENRAHLQAYRHFWIVATESRLLNVQDVGNGETSSTPIELLLRKGKTGENEQIHLSTPCVLPELDKLETIRISSDRYLYGAMEVLRNAHHRRTLLDGQTMFAMRTGASLSHEEDPLGCASLLEHRKGLQFEINVPQTQARPNAISAVHAMQREIRSLTSEIYTLVDRPEIVNTVASIVNVSEPKKGEDVTPKYAEEIALQLFMIRSLILCLHKDKMVIWAQLIALYSSTRSMLDSISLDYEICQSERCFPTNLSFLQDNLEHISKHLVDGLREPLILPSFVQQISHLFSQKLSTHTLSKADTLKALSNYSKGFTQPMNGIQFAKNVIPISNFLNMGRLPSLNVLRAMYQYYKNQSEHEPRQRKIQVMELMARQSGIQFESNMLNILTEVWSEG